MLVLFLCSVICFILLYILYNKVEVMLYKKRALEKTVDLMQYVKHKFTNNK